MTLSMGFFEIVSRSYLHVEFFALSKYAIKGHIGNNIHDLDLTLNMVKVESRLIARENI